MKLFTFFLETSESRLFFRVLTVIPAKAGISSRCLTFFQKFSSSHFENLTFPLNTLRKNVMCEGVRGDSRLRGNDAQERRGNDVRGGSLLNSSFIF
jgi:hypothetical protein